MKWREVVAASSCVTEQIVDVGVISKSNQTNNACAASPLCYNSDTLLD
jgi:hypothetical protein